MSDPMSSAEIEDVLRSIRRLVSDDLRPTLRGMDSPAAMTGDTRLLLTPQLRVVPKYAPNLPPTSPTAVDSTETWEEEADWVQTPLEPMGWSLPEPTEEAPPVADTPIVLLHPLRTGPRFTLSETAEPPVAEPTAEIEDAVLSGPMPTLDLSAHRKSDPDPMAWSPPVDVIETIPSGTPDLVDEEADHGTAIDETWADHAATSAMEDLALDVVTVETLDAANPVPDLDDAKLRELVRAILREELAGPLGEKITRNVRKLVRAEIAQALAIGKID